jgi:hypothetical protein
MNEPRLAPGHSELPRTVFAGQRHLAGFVPPVQIPPDLLVDLVLAQARRTGHVEPVRGRRLPVLLVEVPPPAGRLARVHEDVQPPPRVPVEVLEQQPAPPPPLRPRRELLLAGTEPPGRPHRHLRQ